MTVIQFPGITTADWPVEVALEKAKSWGMESCVIIGFDKDEKLIFGCSTSENGKIMIMLEAAKLEVLKATLDW